MNDLIRELKRDILEKKYMKDEYQEYLSKMKQMGQADNDRTVPLRRQH